MNKLTCKIGDNVVVIEDGELRNGVVKNIYDMVNPPVYAVEFENGIEKVPAHLVAPAPKTETQDEPKRKPRLKPEITITPGEFAEIASQIVAEETIGLELIGISCAVIIGKIREALFLDEGEND